MKKTIVWIVIAGVLGVVGFLALKPAGGLKNVDAAGVIAAQAKGAQVVDVRSGGEFEIGHIPGAVNAPIDQLQASVASWDRNATYVVYCATGSRSAVAVQTMQTMGFKNIDHFASGIQAWTGKLESGAQKTVQNIATSGKPVLVEFYTDS